MSAMETSAAEARDGYRRFFAWTAVISLVLMVAMITVEVFFPQGVRISSQSSAVLGDALGSRAGMVDFDFYDFQLLIMVVSLVSCVASIAGLLIVAFIDSNASRKARRRRVIDAKLRQPTARRSRESVPSPRNVRLRALRDVVHDLE